MRKLFHHGKELTMTVRHKLLLAVLTLALLAGLPTIAWAAGPKVQKGWLRGEVTDIAGDSLTLQTRGGKVTLLVDEETAFDVAGKDATLDDLASGDFVIVRAARGKDGAALARHVAVIPNGSLEDKTLWGIVSAVDGARFELRIPHGQVTVLTDENTLFRIPQVEDGTIADLKVRMPVIVVGQREAEDEAAFYAKAVIAIPAKVLQRHVVRGELTAIEGSTLLL
jgi:hypothetical protein